MSEMILWSRRWSVAQGHHWRMERSCAGSTAQDWLDLFSKDEPSVTFQLARRKPRETKEAN